MNIFTTFLLFAASATALPAAKPQNRPSQPPKNSWGTLDGTPPTLFGHRGDRVLMPEHSIGSYHLASIVGADYVEPDLILSKDGIPVCMHDPDLDQTTDVATRPEFAARKRSLTALMYGTVTTIKDNWFVEDFTAAELKTLRLKQRKVGIRPLYFDHIFGVPTFQEYIDLVKEMSAKLNRPVGLVPELKHASHHADVFGKRVFENKVIEILEKNDFSSHVPHDGLPASQRHINRVVVQSFEQDAAEYIRNRTNYDVMFLIDTDWTRFTPKGLDEVAKFATIFSPWKEVFNTAGPYGYVKSANVTVDPVKLKELGGFIAPDQLNNEVHKRGMRMVVYTFYDSREMTGSRKDELYGFFKSGTDGLFVEDMAEAKSIRDEYGYTRGLMQ